MDQNDLKNEVSVHELKSCIVARKIKEDMQNGSLREGEVLPSSRELASAMEVSLNTISRAMKILEYEGFIVSYDRRFRIAKRPSMNLRESPLPAPQVILVGGSPGVGKSDVGRLLSRMTGWCLINKKTIVRPVAEGVAALLIKSPHEHCANYYSETIKILEYETLLATAKENVSCGNSIIVVAPFIRQFQDKNIMDRITQAASFWGAQVRVVWVTADIHVRSQRISERKNSWKIIGDNNNPAIKNLLNNYPEPVIDYYKIINDGSEVNLEREVRKFLSDIACQKHLANFE